MQGILYEQSAWSFVVLTLAIGGATAYLTGRAVAKAWSPLWTLGIYVVLLGAVLRFLHFALFGDAFFSFSSREANLTALRFLAVELAVLLIGAAIGWRITRTGQMTTQYRWLYEKTSPITWKERPHVPPSPLAGEGRGEGCVLR
jgi:hypothetical protein